MYNLHVFVHIIIYPQVPEPCMLCIKPKQYIMLRKLIALNVSDIADNN